MRRTIRLILLLLAVGAIGVVIGRSVAPPQRPPTREEAEVDVGLDRIVADVNFDETPLDEALETLRQKTAAEIDVHWREMEADGIDVKTPVTLRVANLPLRRVLELVCDQAGGGTVTLEARAHDGAVLFSTAADHASYASVRIYDVRDLLQANYDFRVRLGWQPTTQPAARGGYGVGQQLYGNGGPTPYEEGVETLARVISEYVSPESWRDAGGIVGTIRELNGRFVIAATPGMHDDIAALLEMIRRGK